MGAKKIIGRTLDRHAPTLARALRTVTRGKVELLPPRVYYAAPAIHRLLKRHFAYKRGTFFEVGANDGLDQSNTAYLERYYGWRGVLVEPVPHKFVECVHNRPLSQTIHACLVPRGFKESFVEVTYASLMSVSAISTGVRADSHVEVARQFFEYERPLLGQTFLAPAKTASQVIDEAGLTSIDLFSLDVEGAEMEVLEGLDLSMHRPKAFIVETRDAALMA